jgi:hypothetical protein
VIKQHSGGLGAKVSLTPDPVDDSRFSQEVCLHVVPRVCVCVCVYVCVCVCVCVCVSLKRANFRNQRKERQFHLYLRQAMIARLRFSLTCAAR